MKKILKFEDKVKTWIETNTFKWRTLLFFIGVALGAFSVILLAGASSKAALAGLIGGCLLLLIEILIGGSGVE